VGAGDWAEIDWRKRSCQNVQSLSSAKTEQTPEKARIKTTSPFKKFNTV
jgi:hypothetical protein